MSMAPLKYRFKYIQQPFAGRILSVIFVAACVSMGVIRIWEMTSDPTQRIITIQRPKASKSISADIKELQKCFIYNESAAVKSPDSIILLDDVLKSSKQPSPGKGIFFHVTTCSANRLVDVNARQACAIESAAKWNPTREIFLIFTSPVGFAYNSSPPPLISVLRTYSNIFMRNINLWEYAADTPAHDWLSSDELFRSVHLIEHMSDFVRLISLYKFGGTYMDLDVIIQKSLDNAGSANFAGAESEISVNNAVLSFAHDGIGHEIAEMCINEFQRNFDGNLWSRNGPVVITRVLQQICSVEDTKSMTPDQCREFIVHPKSTFYPIPWNDWFLFFDPKLANRTLNITKDSIAIHVYNSQSGQQRVKVKDYKVAYGIIAEKNCPKVYQTTGEYF